MKLFQEHVLIDEGWEASIFLFRDGTLSTVWIYHLKCGDQFAALLNPERMGLNDLSLEYQCSHLTCGNCRSLLPKNMLDVIKLHLISMLHVEI